MYPKNSSNASAIQEVIAYSYPKLSIGKESYIHFNAFDPVLGKMRRKKIKLNHIGKVSERRKAASDIMKRLTKKLEEGWNPWIEAEQGAAYRKIEDVFEQYRTYANKLLKDAAISKDTHRSYISYLRVIQQWNAKRRVPAIYIYQFDQKYVAELLDYVYLDRNTTPTTRDNYLGFIRTLSVWLIQNCYIKTSPADGFTSIAKSGTDKYRDTISHRDLERLRTYLEQTNKHYLLASYLLFYCCIRPKEMSYLKVEDISINKQILFLRKDITKNNKDSVVTIPGKVLKLMIDLDLFKNPGHYYIFSKDFAPGKDFTDSRKFREYWQKIRENLSFPEKYQFYSLKDTGITDMLKNDKDTISVRDQARHHSLSMTDRYTPKNKKNANSELKNYEGAF